MEKEEISDMEKLSMAYSSIKVRYKELKDDAKYYKIQIRMRDVRIEELEYEVKMLKQQNQ